MREQNYRVGIVGCGNIFPMHAYPVSQLKNTELIAVCDIKPDRAKQRGEEFGCDWYLDYEQMLAQADLDVVHICTPHHLHAPIARLAAEKKLHILTEKPMSITLADAESMIAAADTHGVTLGVIFQNRYNPGSRLIKDALTSGALGRIKAGKLAVTWDRSDAYYANSDWKGTWDKEGGGVIIDQAIHTMDLMRWFVDSDIAYIDANTSNRAHEQIEVEDSAEGVIAYTNGVVTGFYAINYYTYDAPVEIELHCEHGIARMEANQATIRYNNGRMEAAGDNPEETFDYGSVKRYWGVSHVRQITQYYRNLAEGVTPAIDGREAYKTQAMICGIYQSGREGRRITF